MTSPFTVRQMQGGENRACSFRWLRARVEENCRVSPHSWIYNNDSEGRKILAIVKATSMTHPILLLYYSKSTKAYSSLMTRKLSDPGGKHICLQRGKEILRMDKSNNWNFSLELKKALNYLTLSNSLSPSFKTSLPTPCSLLQCFI